jgi:hypothetical protein
MGARNRALWFRSVLFFIGRPAGTVKVKSLDLALFIYTQNHGFVGKIQIESHHVASPASSSIRAVGLAIGLE